MTSSSRVAWCRLRHSAPRRGHGLILPRTLCALLILALVGCVSNVSTPTQPAPQSVDLTMAKSLLVIQTIIEGDPKAVPPTTGLRGLAATNPTFKTQINQVIAGYNLAETSYLSFHADLAAGKNPDPAAISAQIADILAKAQALVMSVK